MPILIHGTTLQRAQGILRFGPDSAFVEPGGTGTADGFSMCFKNGPFPLGHPEDYAFGKAAQFPGELGPALISVDVPDEIIELAVDGFFPRSQGIVQFEVSRGLEELLHAWQLFQKEIRCIERK